MGQNTVHGARIEVREGVRVSQYSRNTYVWKGETLYEITDKGRDGAIVITPDSQRHPLAPGQEMNLTSPEGIVFATVYATDQPGLNICRE